MLNNKKFLFFILCFVYFIIYFFLFYNQSNKGLEIVFFDVGQGDAIFIETKSGQQILIDGGPDKLILEKLNQEMPFWDRSLDLVVLTHPDADHLTGLISVLEYFKVGKIITSGLETDSFVYQRWKEIIKQRQNSIILAQAGQRMVLDGGAIIEILWPDQEIIGDYSSKANNVSVVIKLIYQEAEFLLPGDIEAKVERELVNRAGGLLGSDLLKVAHHGSKSSTIQEFIQSVDPQVAVISVGGNNYYGHPHQEVISRLDDLVLLRTDYYGDVQVETDGDKIWLKLEKNL